MVAAVQQGVVLPTLTFTDRLTLHAGDRTVRLVAAGQRHSYGDVLIHLPEEHVLFTVGTANPVGYIPYVSKISHAQDIQRVVAVFGEFSDPSLGLTHIITGHGPELKREDLAFAGAYYDRLWKKLSGMQGTGGTVEQAKQQLALESAFVDMLPAGAIPEASKKTHTHNIEALWALLEPAPAAADKAAPR
jgi:cyclase